MANLRSFRQAETARVEIKDPADGAPLGIFFELAGPTHPERKRIAFALARKTLRHYEKKGKFDMPDPEEAEETKAENLAAYTLGWEGWTDEQGRPVPFSRDEALKLYRDPGMAWLVQQIEAAVGDLELFIRRSATA